MSSSYDSAVVDEAMIHHPDLVRASTVARWLYVEALVWSRVHRTDGIVPKHVLRLVSIEPAAEGGAIELVQCGRWVDSGDQWEMVGFLDTQMSAARVAQERDLARQRKLRMIERESGTRSERVPRAGLRSGAAEKPHERTRSERVQNGTDPTRPDPKGREGRGAARGASSPSPSGGSSAPLADRRWTPERKAKQAATRALHSAEKRRAAEEQAARDTVLVEERAVQKAWDQAEWLRGFQHDRHMPDATMEDAHRWHRLHGLR